MKNLDVGDFVANVLEDPNVERQLDNYLREVNTSGVSLKLRDDCLLWGGFSRGVEYGAGLGVRSLVKMSSTTTSALAEIRQILPALGDDECKMLTEVLDRAYEQLREGMDMARYLCVSNEAVRYGIPAGFLQKFLDGPQNDDEYMRLGLLASMAQPRQYNSFVIVEAAGKTRTLECHCAACLLGAALAALSESGANRDAMMLERPDRMLKAFGRSIVHMLRESIDRVSQGDIRTGHDAGEPDKTARDLLDSLLRRRDGE